MYIINDKGPSLDPCGIPALICSMRDFLPSTTTICFLLCKYKLNSWRHDSVIPFCFSFSINPSCQIFSKADATSRKRPCVILPDCHVDLIRWVRYISWFEVESFFIYAACLTVIRLFSVRWERSLWFITDSHIFAKMGNKQIGRYNNFEDFNPFCFHIAVTCAILNSSGKKPSWNISLNKVLKGNEIGVAISERN